MERVCARLISRVAWRAAVAGFLCGKIAGAQAAGTGSAAGSPAVSIAAVPASSGAIPANAQDDVATPAAPADTAAAQFVTTCSGCHTIGGGVSRGPDLKGVSAWPEPQLAQAIKSMERKVGPLSASQVDALVALLKDKAVDDRIGTARKKLVQVSVGPQQPPDSLFGGALFFGKSGLENGGMACSACHRFHGEGGDLGPDLSQFADSTEQEALPATIGRAAFPVMRAAYEGHPITQQEARHLAAFLEQAKQKRVVAPLSETSLTGFGVGVGAFILALVLIFRRPKGVRARLIRRTTKR